MKLLIIHIPFYLCTYLLVCPPFSIFRANRKIEPNYRKSGVNEWYCNNRFMSHKYTVTHTRMATAGNDSISTAPRTHRRHSATEEASHSLKTQFGATQWEWWCAAQHLLLRLALGCLWWTAADWRRHRPDHSQHCNRHTASDSFTVDAHFEQLETTGCLLFFVVEQSKVVNMTKNKSGSSSAQPTTTNRIKFAVSECADCWQQCHCGDVARGCSVADGVERRADRPRPTCGAHKQTYIGCLFAHTHTYISTNMSM